MLCCLSHREHLGVACWVLFSLTNVVALADDDTVMNDERTDRNFSCSATAIREGQRLPHEAFAILILHSTRSKNELDPARGGVQTGVPYPEAAGCQPATGDRP